jgi:CheY-like chemotaxis protein
MTETLSLPPYFHPTTVCLVDDNESFLRSLSLEIPETLAFRVFTDPQVALDLVNRPLSLPPLVDRCFSMERRSSQDPVIHLDLDMIEQEINHRQRFERISVVLVDYAMPSVDGLQFCARVRDPYVRKAMLTGVADEKLAVEAFNAGLIHRFIPKHTATAIDKLLSFIEELQQTYFNQYTARLQNALAIDPPGFLVDQVIAGRVKQLAAANQLVEYYLVDDPPGFLMLRADGSVVRLVLLNDEERQQQLKLARQYHAPAEIISGLESGKLLALLSGDSPADYFGPEPFPWSDNVAPAEQIQGTRNWHLALFLDPATDIDFEPSRCSYNAYLATLDPE